MRKIIIRYNCKKILLVLLFLLITVCSFAGDRWWTQIGPKGNVPIQDGAHCVVIDPSNSDIVYCLANVYNSGDYMPFYGIYKSMDSGLHWKKYHNGILYFYGSVATFSMYPLIIDQSNPQILYAGSGYSSISRQRYGEVFKSIDGGVNWSEMIITTNWDWMISLTIDPNNSQNIYASSDNRYIYFSKDGGITWDTMSRDTYSLYEIKVNPLNSQILFAAAWAGGFGISYDAGTTWSHITADFGGNNVYDYVINPLNPDTLYAGTLGSGVYKSSDGGNTWLPCTTGIGNLQVTSLAINPLNPEIIYAGAYYSISSSSPLDGIYISINGGANWILIAPGIRLSLHGITIDSINPQILYYGAGDGVYKSIDGGTTWNWHFEEFRAYKIKDIAISKSSSNTIYASTESGIYKTSDEGTTWTAFTTGMKTKEISSIVIDSSNLSTLYAGTNYGAYKSIDGTTWAALTTGMGEINILSIIIEPANPNNIYTGTSQGVYKSIDSGTTWAAMTTGIGTKQVNTLLMDPTIPGTLYAGTQNNGIYKCTDYGLSWTTTGLRYQTVLCLAIDTINSYLYAGTAYAGLYKSTDGGNSWSQKTNVSQYIYSLFIDPANPQIIYAGLYVNGVYMSNDFGETWYPMNQGLIGPEYIYDLNLSQKGFPVLYCGTSEGVWEYSLRPTAVEPRLWQELF
jgi:photosystem II stability/assembly factor-like uncharacterized protein